MFHFVNGATEYTGIMSNKGWQIIIESKLSIVHNLNFHLCQPQKE